MIVLDTNVLSELMRSKPERSVVAWLDQQPPESVWTTAISVFEVRFGLQILPHGARRRRLNEAFERAIADTLGARVLPFDDEAATAAAKHAAERRTAGKPLDFRDLEIAGIASSRHAAIVTRTVDHFLGLGIGVVNPWERDAPVRGIP